MLALPMRILFLASLLAVVQSKDFDTCEGFDTCEIAVQEKGTALLQLHRHEPEQPATNAQLLVKAEEGCGTATIPLDEEACKEAANKEGLQLGGEGHAFAGHYPTKGCYTYSSGKYKGHAYFGTMATSTQQMLDIPPKPKLRLDLMQQPLTEAGFLAMTSQCCLLQADLWLRRYIPSIEMEICDQGGLNGFLPFVSCNSQMSFDHLKAALLDVMSADCPWANKLGFCQPLDAKCMGVYDPTSHRRRVCKSTTTKAPTSVTCCAKAPGRFLEVTLLQNSNTSVENASAVNVESFASDSPPKLNTSVENATAGFNASTVNVESFASDSLPKAVGHRRFDVPVVAARAPNAAITSTSAFNCAVHPKPTQVMFNPATDVMEVKELTVDTGDYTVLYSIPRDRTDPPFFKKKMNSCAINPVDSILYCGVEVTKGKGEFIVRVDENKVEFVAKIPNKGNSAAFSSTGTFYWTYKLGAFRIEGLDGMPGVSDPTQVTKDMSQEKPFKTGGDDNPEDIVALAGYDLDDSGDAAEYVLGLGKTMVAVTKVTAAGFQKTWRPSVQIEGSPGGGYGAAWNYGGKLYFANNAGNGVYQLDPDDIDVVNGAIPVKKVGKSDATGNNDGVNCMTAEPPFPDRGECDFGYQEVQPVNGACPAGSQAQ